MITMHVLLLVMTFLLGSHKAECRSSSRSSHLLSSYVKQHQHSSQSKYKKPVRIIVVTTWRSGSTFLAQALTTGFPGYYHNEPLHAFGMLQIRTENRPDQKEHVMGHLRRALDCVLDETVEPPWEEWNWKRTTGHVIFSETAKQRRKLYLRGVRCRRNYNQVQIMKTVRIRLGVISSLLEWDKLDVRILYLVRDPRGIMNSRKRLHWIGNKIHPDVSNMTNLCSDMTHDYIRAKSLLKMYPDKFRIVRYEDVASDATKEVLSIYKFLGLPYNRAGVLKFLVSHSKPKKVLKSGYSTFRNGTERLSGWQTELEAEEIRSMESKCHTCLKLWGYQEIAQSL